MAGERKYRFQTRDSKSRYGVTVKVEGLDELVKGLKEVGLSVNSSLRTAMREGMKVIQQEAESNARAITKRKATRIEVSTHGSREGSRNVTVTLSPSKKAWYLGFFETGAKPHQISGRRGRRLYFKGRKGNLVVVRSVRHPGMRARPWLRPAYEAKREAAVGKVSEVLRKAIETKRASNAGG
jgi:HK97 gp10 family phage protein